MTPEELLDAADQLLTSPVPGLGSLWPRACALLIRLALELTLDRYWARVLPEAAACGMRQQLLLLPLCAGTSPSPISTDAAPALDAASLAREAWLGLAGSGTSSRVRACAERVGVARLAHGREPASRPALPKDACLIRPSEELRAAGQQAGACRSE